MSATRQAKPADKSLFVAYLCWLFGGLYGLHHLYLGRDLHAFITFSTFGGYFTLGLLRDLWRLPEYVKDANNDLGYLNRLHAQIRTFKRPPSGVVRQSGLMIMGNLFSHLVNYAIPPDALDANIVIILKIILIPAASASGVWVAGNVGRHQGSFWLPLLAAYVGALPSSLFDIPHGSFSTLAATIVFNRYCKRWRLQNREPKPLYVRTTVFVTVAIIYLSLWASWLYFSCTIEDPETSEQIKCRIALENFINSEAFSNLSEAIFGLVEHVRNQGFMGLWKEMMSEFDVSGRSSALAKLELSYDATPQDIVAQYKKLSRQYHPDRERDESKKAEKHEKFIQVQEAYRKLEPGVHRYKLQPNQPQHQSQDESRDEL